MTHTTPARHEGAPLKNTTEFSPYRLESQIGCTSLNEHGLGAGFFALSKADKEQLLKLREQFYIATDNRRGFVEPSCDLLKITSTVEFFERFIQNDDVPISMENILLTNEHRGQRWQRWICQEVHAGVCVKLNPIYSNYMKYRNTGHLPFTGQPVLGASYGLMQVLYTTAVREIEFLRSGVGAPPSEMFEPVTSVALGTAYTVLKSLLTIRSLQNLDSASEFADLDELQNRLGVALAFYNGSRIKTVGENATRICFTETERSCIGLLTKDNLTDYASDVIVLGQAFFPNGISGADE